MNNNLNERGARVYGVVYIDSYTREVRRKYFEYSHQATQFAKELGFLFIAVDFPEPVQQELFESEEK